MARPTRRNRLRFRPDDPLRYLHVSRRKRKTEDEPGDPRAGSDAGGPEDFDREAVRSGGGVVSEDELA